MPPSWQGQRTHQISHLCPAKSWFMRKLSRCSSLQALGTKQIPRGERGPHTSRIFPYRSNDPGLRGKRDIHMRTDSRNARATSLLLPASNHSLVEDDKSDIKFHGSRSQRSLWLCDFHQHKDYASAAAEVTEAYYHQEARVSRALWMKRHRSLGLSPW